MRKTVKYLSALTTVRLLPDGKSKRVPDHDELYAQLGKNNYRWDSKRGEWKQFTTPPNARKTGVVDLRMRATLGDVERAAHAIGTTLEAAGFKIIRMGAPDPDDRHGPATTARIYMQWILPEEK